MAFALNLGGTDLASAWTRAPCALRGKPHEYQVIFATIVFFSRGYPLNERGEQG
jgi:hypothetical protein